MSEKSEKAAREIEALLKEHGLFIDDRELRHILVEEFEKGGDVKCNPTKENPGDLSGNAEPTVQPAGSAEYYVKRKPGIECIASPSCYVPVGSANFTPKEIINWLREHPGACPICGGKPPRLATDELAYLRLCVPKLREQLLTAKNKAYTDYREYVGLVSQNEALRRQVDELQHQITESGHGGM
jgi:hypothetical protein